MTLVIDINAGDLVTLRAGNVITHLKLYSDINQNAPIFDIPSFLVLKSTPKGEINGRFTYDINGILEVDLHVPKTGERRELATKGFG